ncbi:S8 family serine peptidase [Thermoleptolyngbya sichuanensis A183]|uniref:S8 family serine peptidase n=1 Tax=Thermoleptolyngbya sichuanensis A183 TaxID=2737172 RepID=A0A6M8BL94_9CYAN|nr:S8 family serine peptidase [Thermoleptolyngbya sichuanensis A183]
MARRLRWVMAGLATSLLGTPAIAYIASMTSMEAGGIDARRVQSEPYNLMGRKIAIGQVEIGRPALFGLDKTAANNFAVRVRQVFFRDGVARPNDTVDPHAASVASVMVSNDKLVQGVAPEAKLYAAAAGFERRGGQPQECLASQTVALQNGDDVRAINFSFGESLAQDPRPNARLDGNALLTQCIDWSANQHNVLYVIAGNQGEGGIPIPTDNFNGMIVSNSIAVNGVYRKVSFFDLGSEPPPIYGRAREPETNVGPRRSVSLMAPGTNIQTINPDGSLSNPATGTSFAAPHVTAMVALLQEYGDRQIREQQPNWSLDARRHEVMKAVMMNAADKIQDRGDGLMLGMTRTAVNKQNRDWLSSDAYTDEAKPLDADMGTGHLHAYRSLIQFGSGQFSPDAPVPPVGWDYRTVGTGRDAPAYRDYVLERPLVAGSHVAITLAWNRVVELKDTNRNGLYDIGETFEDKGLNNLDVYLMRAEDEREGDRIWSSVSAVDSVEHIFHPVPATGRYKIRVVYRDRVNTPTQAYALAWWTAPAE